jgi:hypothetical protein
VLERVAENAVGLLADKEQLRQAGSGGPADRVIDPLDELAIARVAG